MLLKKKVSITMTYSVALSSQEIPGIWGAMSQDKNQICTSHIFDHLNDQIYISQNSKYYKIHSYSFMHISSQFQNNTKKSIWKN